MRVRPTTRPGARGAALFAALLLGAPPAVADSPLRLTTTLESDTAWRVRSPRELQKSQNELELDASLALSPSLELRMIGRAIYDPRGKLIGDPPDPGFRPVDRVKLGGSRHFEAELREAYLDWHGRLAGARVDVRAGKQQIVWGQSLGLRILDLVNPQDFREVILDDFVDARIPTFALRADAVVRGVSLQGFAVPDFEPDLWPALSSEYALNSGVPGVLPALAPLPNDPLLAGGGPLLVPGEDRRPHDWRFESLGYGLRVAGTVSGFDLGVYGFDRVDPSPVTRRRVSSLPVPGVGPVPLNLLDTDYARVRSVGVSFARALGDFAVWSEGALSYGRAFATEDLGDADGWVSRPDLAYTLGLDWSGNEGWFVNLQWIEQKRFGPTHGVEVDRVRRFASLYVRGEVWGERLVPQLLVLVGVNDREAMIRPMLEWRASDRLSLAVGGDLWSGPRDGLLGQYAHPRSCASAPLVVPLPTAGACGFEPPPGEPSRVYVRLRYAFDSRF